MMPSRHGGASPVVKGTAYRLAKDPVVYVVLGSVVWAFFLLLDAFTADYSLGLDPIPKAVEITWLFCGIAYGCNLLINLLKLLFMNQPFKTIHLLTCYVSLLASLTYFSHWTGFAIARVDMKSLLYLPNRWLLYVCTMPAIWWILAHISAYTVKRKLYVLWLNFVMIFAGGIATYPGISWAHKVYWMALSCVPFPELCFHIWQMVTDAIHYSPELKEHEHSTRVLHFIRIYGQFCYQFFPAIYFAAFDGCIPLEVSEPLWSICDWSFKMVMTSSLMEANYFTIAQRREYVLRIVEQAQSFHTMKQLTLAVERKDNFLSAMSHELRTPLNGIMGMAEAVTTISRGNLSPAVQHTIDVIKFSGKRLLQLINDILDVAQIQKGVLLIRHEPVELPTLIDDVIELMLPLVPAGVKLVRKVGAIPVITADGRRLTQIIFNLVGNACKFTSKGQVKVMAGFSSATNMVFCSVRDTGCGIPQHDIKKIFKVFEQGDMTSTRHHGGTGLGLHLVKELVRGHRGTIAITSKLGEGTVFTVWLPLDQPRDDAGAPPWKDHISMVEVDELQDPEFESEVEEKLCSWVGAALTVEQHPQQAKPSSRRRLSPKGHLHRLASGGPHIVQGQAAPPNRSQARGSESNLSTHLSTLSRASSASLKDNTGDSRELLKLSSNSQTMDKLTSHMRLRHSEVYRKHLILTVDDDPVNQMVFWNLLQPQGYALKQAIHGNEAMQMLEESDTLPDIILLDCMMPDISGYEVCSMIRSKYGYGIPILMVSANSSGKQVLLGLQEGANDYIKKPFHRDELNMRIRSQIRTSELLAQELEARSPTALLHMQIPVPLQAAILGGATQVSLGAMNSAVLHLRLPMLELGSSGISSTVLQELMTSVKKLVAAACVEFGALQCHMAGAALTCIPDPTGASEAEQCSRMRLLAESLLQGFAAVPHSIEGAMLPSIALVRGHFVASVLNPPASVPCYHVVGSAMDEAYKLSRVTLPGSIYMLRCDDAGASENPDLAVASAEVLLDGRPVTVATVKLASSTSEPLPINPTALDPLCVMLADLRSAEVEFEDLMSVWHSFSEQHTDDKIDALVQAKIAKVEKCMAAWSTRPQWVAQVDGKDTWGHDLTRLQSLAHGLKKDGDYESWITKAAKSERQNELNALEAPQASNMALGGWKVGREALDQTAPIARFCVTANATKYTKTFVERGVSVHMLASMTESQLLSYGVDSMGERLRLIIQARKCMGS